MFPERPRLADALRRFSKGREHGRKYVSDSCRDHELRGHLAHCLGRRFTTGAFGFQADTTSEARSLARSVNDAQKSENGLSSEALLAPPGGTALVESHEARVGAQRRVAVVRGQITMV